MIVLASERQYAHHLLPVHRALPGSAMAAGPDARSWLVTQGVDAEPIPRRFPGDALVASWSDYGRARRMGARRIAYMEHGCGQSYAGERRTARAPSYAGGDGRDGCSLILAPNEHAARRWQERYPEVPVRIIGATRVLTPPEDLRRPTLAIAFHWNGPSPEQRTALPHYLRDLRSIAERLPVIGTGHPRAARTLARAFDRLGIEWVPDIDEVARRATVYAVDNSSTLWEMGLHRPTIALDAPWYREHIHHGLRFWSHAGVRVPDAPSLAALADRLLYGGEEPQERDRRLGIVSEVIPRTDGANIAAGFLTEWAEAA